MPKPPSASISNAWSQRGISQKNGTSALIARVLHNPA